MAHHYVILNLRITSILTIDFQYFFSFPYLISIIDSWHLAAISDQQLMTTPRAATLHLCRFSEIPLQGHSWPIHSYWNFLFVVNWNGASNPVTRMDVWIERYWCGKLVKKGVTVVLHWSKVVAWIFFLDAGSSWCWGVVEAKLELNSSVVLVKDAVLYRISFHDNSNSRSPTRKPRGEKRGI